VTFPERCTRTLKKKPTAYLRQLYFDSLVFTSEALRHLVAETGSGQIVMGTDYPYPWTQTSVDHILEHAGPDRRRARRHAGRDRRQAARALELARLGRFRRAGGDLDAVVRLHALVAPLPS
jgi:hypothetical protein